MSMSSDTAANPTTTDTRPFDVFISYSTASDYRIARRLEAFVESFHRTRTGRTAGLRALEACLDGSDFRIDPGERSADAGLDGATITTVPQVIERHLEMSATLLVLCSPSSMRSSWVRGEIAHFLRHRGAASIRLAIADDGGADPDPATFFCPEIVEAGLHETIWYDLRGFHRANRNRPRVRDYDSERLRLVADLHGRSASSIETLWQAEQRDAARRRTLIGGATAVIIAAVGAVAWVQYQASRQEAALKQVAEALQHRFANPATALATAHLADPTAAADPRDAAIGLFHEVLVHRRYIARKRLVFETPGRFEWYSHANSAVFTKLSPDGRHALLVTERKGNPYSPVKPGEVYLLDNQTLDLIALEPCGRGQTKSYRVDFADFLGGGAILVGRAFHVELYKLDGSCLAREDFQLRASKSPITAAGGMLYDVFFVAGNGSGCIWVEEYGNVGLVDPSEELSVVTHCDTDIDPDPVLEILTDATGRWALSHFYSGRLDLFGLDGLNGRPKRRDVVDRGAVAAAFRPGSEEQSFAIAITDGDASRVEAWRIVDKQPVRQGNLPLGTESVDVDFIAFADDGRHLAGLDTDCSLYLWDWRRKALAGPARPFQGQCR